MIDEKVQGENKCPHGNTMPTLLMTMSFSEMKADWEDSSSAEAMHYTVLAHILLGYSYLISLTDGHFNFSTDVSVPQELGVSLTDTQSERCYVKKFNLNEKDESLVSLDISKALDEFIPKLEQEYQKQGKEIKEGSWTPLDYTTISKILLND